MKKYASILAVVALLAMPATTFGTAEVWFELGAGSTSGVMTVGNVGPGNVLELQKDASAGDYTLNLTMFTRIVGTPLYNVSTTFYAQGDEADGTRATAFAAVPPPGGAATPNSGLNVFGPGPIATNLGASTFSPPGYSGDAVNLGTLTVVVTKGANAFDGAVTEITARVGNLLWAQSDFQPAQVKFGGGDFVNGGTIGAGQNVVVRITNVPEPATLSLLAMGAVALIRRRR